MCACVRVRIDSVYEYLEQAFLKNDEDPFTLQQSCAYSKDLYIFFFFFFLVWERKSEHQAVLPSGSSFCETQVLSTSLCCVSVQASC